MKRTAVILAGGAGTRLWPLSSDDHPKQFLQIFNGESLLQITWRRLEKLVGADAIYISTNERYRQKCIDQLPPLLPGNVITEPARRNTAPAIALCTFTIEERHGDNVTGFFPSDHYIGNESEFLRIVDNAYAFAEAHDSLVTIGITPTEPSTGYGYLELGADVGGGVTEVKRFAEKPSRERAEEFLRAGNFAWNGGMFVWRSSVFRTMLGEVAPDVARTTLETYAEAPSISIDYALMEKARRVATVRGEFDWSDVGSWAAIAKYVASRKERVFTEQADGAFVHTSSNRDVAVVGVPNVAVIESPNGILVLDLAKAEILSSVAKRITDGER
jgi:mannose-1-phosphate guanylyltransferase